ncbi:MAG: hypothetical protein D3923_17220, partial [Candidatus Electrothrix sp. AR3]|nr:hypothetical protein [Candidatus Electrothrix sp. AR3]
MEMYQYIRRSEQIEKKKLRHLLVLILLFLSAVNSPAQQKKIERLRGKMIFLPFTIQTTSGQEHLAAGLPNILATRLTAHTGLTAVSGDNTEQLRDLLHKGEQRAAKKILQKMQGDYLFVSSLEQQGIGYQLSIHVFSGQAAPAFFARTAPSLERIIPLLNELSVEIAEKVFQKKTLTKKPKHT